MKVIIFLQIGRVHNPQACPAFYKKLHNLLDKDDVMSEFRDHLKGMTNRFPQFNEDPDKLNFLHDLSKASAKYFYFLFLLI